MKLCIYHANCLDGFGAAYCHWLGNGTPQPEDADWQYVPMDYNKINTVADLFVWFPLLEDTSIIHDVDVLDFSFSADVTQYLITAQHINFRMLDHHKTAFEMLKSLGYHCDYPAEYKLQTPTAYVQLDNERSGALQAADLYANHLSADAKYIMARIDDRDRWQFKFNDTRQICEAMANQSQHFVVWYSYIKERFLSGLIFQEGALLFAKKQKLCEQIAAEHTTRQIWNHSVKFCNCPPQFASEVGNILAGQGEYIGACYHVTKEDTVKFSLRSVGDVDVSKIALEYGGGGHKNAAGFTVPLPTIEILYVYAEHCGAQIMDADEFAAAPAAPNHSASTGHAEADRIVARLMSSDPDFQDCADAAALIQREIKGPDGFATWRDAAIAERLKRIASATVPAEVPMPQGYVERPSDYTGDIWIESQMRTYGDAREAAGYARGMELYNQLLFAVSTHHPDETRHETALRYIRQAEESINSGCQAAQKGGA